MSSFLEVLGGQGMPSSRDDAEAIRKFLDTNPAWLNEDQIHIERLFADRLEVNRQGFIVASPGFGKTRVHIGVIAALTSHFCSKNRLFVWVTINDKTVRKNLGELKTCLPGRFDEEGIAVYSGNDADQITDKTRIFVTTPTKLQRIIRGEIKHNLAAHIRPDTVFLPDETHVTITDLRNIATQYFRQHNCVDLGVTATPAFSDGRTVGDIAYGGQEPFYVLPTRVAVQRGYNCQMGFGIYDVRIKVDKDEIVRSAPAGTDGALLQRYVRKQVAIASLDARIKAMVTSWGTDRNPYTGKPLFKTKTIDFLPSQISAEDAAKAYNDMYGHLMPEGKKVAAFIHSDMTADEQKKVLDAHKAGNIYVITNVRCLAAAHDDVEVENVSVIWETQSELLLQQEIGRAFRYNHQDPDKFAYLRQWVDLRTNPKAVLITEALDSYDPLVRFNFPKIEAETKEAVVVHLGGISYTMCSTPHALQSITKLAKLRRDSKQILPPAPDSYLSVDNVISTIRGNKPLLKPREYVRLRKLFMAIERSFQQQAEHHDEIAEVVVKDENFADGSFKVKAVYAGTPLGNMLHVNFDDLHSLFATYPDGSYTKLSDVHYEAPVLEPVSKGLYIDSGEARILMRNLSRKAKVDFSGKEQDMLIAYLNACPNESKKTSIGISTKTVDGNVKFHAEELARYVFQRLIANSTNIKPADGTKYLELKKQFDKNYRTSKLHLAVECNATIVKNALEKFGFDFTDQFTTKKLMVDNVGFLFDVAAEEIRSNIKLSVPGELDHIVMYQVEPGIIAVTIQCNKQNITFKYSIDKDGRLERISYSDEVPKPRWDYSNVFYEGNYYVSDAGKVFADINVLPFRLKEGFVNGNYFDGIRYDVDKHNQHKNALPHFIPATEEDVRKLLAKHDISATEEDITEFLKKIPSRCKRMSAKFSTSVSSAGIPDHNFHDDFRIGPIKQRMSILWSAMAYDDDKVKDVIAAIPEYEVVRYFEMVRQVSQTTGSGLEAVENGFADTYIAAKGDLFMECDDVKILEALKALGFDTDNQDAKNLSMIFLAIGRHIITGKLEPSPEEREARSDISIYRNINDDIYVEIRSGTRDTLVLHFIYTDDKLFLHRIGDVGSIGPSGYEIYEGSFQFSGHDKAFFQFNEFVYFALQAYGGDDFKDIKYNEKLQEKHLNAIPGFVPITEEAITALLRKHQVPADRERVKQFVKSIKALCKDIHEHTLGAVGDDDDDDEPTYHYYCEDFEGASLGLLWSARTIDLDKVDRIKPAIAEHEVLKSFGMKREASPLAALEAAISEPAKLAKLLQEKPKEKDSKPNTAHSFLKGFTTELTAQRAFVRA